MYYILWGHSNFIIQFSYQAPKLWPTLFSIYGTILPNSILDNLILTFIFLTDKDKHKCDILLGNC